MSKKRAIILGAGISGLSLAWYLQRLHRDLDIVVLEKSERAGGWLHTDCTTGFLFEKGPRAFKASKSLATLQLLHELHLDRHVIWSEEKAHPRYLWHDHQLCRLPKGPLSFLTSPLTRGLVPALLKEWRKGVYEEDETVWNFVSRRFNSDVASLLFDPMVIGIFGGDSRYISVRACFPILKQWEEQYGSVTRGFLKTRNEKKKESQYSHSISHIPMSAMYTLELGVGQLIDALLKQTQMEVRYQTEVTAIYHGEDHVQVVANDQVLKADLLFCALPVAQTGFLLKPLVPDIAEQLAEVKSKSVVIVNVGYTKSVLPIEGFGYLTSTQDNEDVLGVVFDSSVFSEHNERSEETRLTIKLKDQGLSKESMIEMALQGIKKHLKITQLPDVVSYQMAVNAIPQYGINHLSKMKHLEESLMQRLPLFRFAGNYLSGVSVDQCIARSLEISCITASVSKL